jgi:hypothetical protein
MLVVPVPADLRSVPALLTVAAPPSVFWMV